MKLNCDMGESFGAWNMGNDHKVMPLVDMANIACGFHASDPNIMQHTVSLAEQHQVSIGAHPSYHDLQGFGRRSITYTPQEITNAVLYQTGALDAICKAHQTQVDYIKPHGALYNDMMRNQSIFEALLAAAKILRLPLMILATQNQDYDHLAKEHGVTLIKEAFIDRRYLSNGLLSPRTMDGSVMHEWEEIKHQVEAMLHNRPFKSIEGDEIKLQADTLCVHGDNPIAVEITAKVRALSMQVKSIYPVGEFCLLIRFSDVIDPRLPPLINHAREHLLQHYKAELVQAVPSYTTLLLEFTPLSLMRIRPSPRSVRS